MTMFAFTDQSWISCLFTRLFHVIFM